MKGERKEGEGKEGGEEGRMEGEEVRGITCTPESWFLRE